MKYLLGTAGLTAVLLQSWLYFGPLLLNYPLFQSPPSLFADSDDSDDSDMCVFNASTSATSAAPTPSSVCSTSSTTAGLSVDHTADRADEIRYMAANLVNEERVWPIDGQDLPSYMGPVARPGSVAEQLQRQDLLELSALKPDTPELMAALAARWLPRLTSADAYTEFYELFRPVVDAPLTAVDHGDAAFGASRLSERGFNLRAIRADDPDPVDATLTAANVAALCGANASVQTLRERKALFVVDLSTIGQWGDASVRKVNSTQPTVDEQRTVDEQLPTKYLPSVLGYFCFTSDAASVASATPSATTSPASGQLVPLAITLLDSGVTYTPLDPPNEWQLAKTALNAAEATFQQMQHFAESHTLSIPIRVELYRSLATRHPVRALLLRHFAWDFGLEQQAGVVLFNASTPLDRTFGLGAAGCVRFLHDARRRISLDDDVFSDVTARGVAHLPGKYAAYGKLHHAAIASFLASFLDVYYPADEGVLSDVELQNWAAACAEIPHLHAFPSRFEDKAGLAKLLTRLLFQSAVKHHAMNGEVTWNTVAMPYSAPALWKPLPDRKQRDGHPEVDVFSYLQPRELFPVLVFLTALFNRPRPAETTLQSAYHVPPFSQEPRLAKAIRTYDDELRAIDAFIVANEQHEPQPYHVLRPGNLPHNTWI
ncbi:hypothetical protein BBJ28_00018710 [Nothophytophthora sp. Chile5]|nr:hypothetical protein BBJ28_00018710 [Nothophytophthora sp. Chile5]